MAYLFSILLQRFLTVPGPFQKNVQSKSYDSNFLYIITASTADDAVAEESSYFYQLITFYLRWQKNSM